MRKFKLETGKFYHIYNRGVDKREVFLDEGDYVRFLRSILEFNRIDPIGSLVDLEERLHSESNSLAADGNRANEADSLKGIGSLTSVAKEKTIAKESNSLAADGIRANEADSLKGIGSLTTSAPQRLVDFIAYCLNPNHYHFILRQLVDDGISKFMHKLSLGYTCYFNIKNSRSGSLFQGKFKSVQIDSEEHLLYVAAYVNGNAQIHGIVPDAAEYKWCSYPEYLGKSNLNICEKSEILDKFEDIASFQKASEECFVKMKERKDLQKYILD